MTFVKFVFRKQKYFLNLAKISNDEKVFTIPNL